MLAEVAVNADLAASIEVTGETPMMAEEEAAIFEEFKQVAASQVGTPAQEAEAPAPEPAAPAAPETPTRAAAKAPPPLPPEKEKDESARPELG